MILKAISALLHSPQKFSKKFTDVEIHLTQFCFSQFFRSFQIQTPNTNCNKFRVQLTICILQLSKKGLGLIVPFFKKTSTCQSSKNRRDRHDDVCISDICVCVLYLHVFCNGCIPSHFLCRNISFNRLHYYVPMYTKGHDSMYVIVLFFPKTGNFQPQIVNIIRHDIGRCNVHGYALLMTQRMLRLKKIHAYMVTLAIGAYCNP